MCEKISCYLKKKGKGTSLCAWLLHNHKLKIRGVHSQWAEMKDSLCRNLTKAVWISSFWNSGTVWDEFRSSVDVFHLQLNLFPNMLQLWWLVPPCNGIWALGYVAFRDSHTRLKSWFPGNRSWNNGHIINQQATFVHVSWGTLTYHQMENFKWGKHN